MEKKFEELLSAVKLGELLRPVKQEETKKDNPYVVALVIIGAVALIAAIAYAVYYFFVPDRVVDVDDDFDYDYDDELFEEDDSEDITDKEVEVAEQESDEVNS